MRISSPKTICTGILVLGLVGAAALAGGSYAVHRQTTSSFSEEGYIISYDEDEDSVVTNTQIRFAEGTKWKSTNASYVTFRDENNNSVNVDADSFIHYGSMSIASTAAGTITDLDQYQRGVLESYYLYAGSILTNDGDSFTIETGDSIIRMQDFVWKNSAEHYLFGSPQITINLADGQQVVTSSGFLEVGYIDDDETVIRMSDGENAWQVFADGTTIELANGVVTDCNTGEIVTLGGSEDTDSATDSGQTLSLGNISIDSEGSIVVAQSQSSEAPTFKFTLTNGENGSDGENGTTGQSGDNGSDGEAGEDGQEGEQGADGDTGQNGSAGENRGPGEKGAEGGVNVGEDLNIGLPTVSTAGNWNWKWDSSTNTYTLDFGVYYDFIEEDVADLTLEDDKAYYYLYDMETGERVSLPGSVNGIVYWEGTIPFKDETDQDYKTGTITGLLPNKTYCLVVGDTYTMTGNTYSRFVMERVFTVGGSTVSVALTDRDSDSFDASISVSESDDPIKVTGVKWTATVAGGTESVSGETTFTGDTLDFTISGLKSDTTYDVECEVTYETGSNKEGSVNCNNTWVTTKKTPTVGGITLTSEDGYLKAEVLGAYNTTSKGYDALSDPDNTIESITFLMYRAEDINKALQNTSVSLGDVVPFLKTEVTGVSYAYFQVDGENFVNNYNYYAMAIYTYNNGQTEVTAPVYDTDTSATTTNPKEIGYVKFPTNTKLAVGYAQAKKSSEVTLSFSGTGSGTYNNSTDETEGSSYDSLHGSVLVNLNGVIVRVDDAHKLTLTVTDALTYKKDYIYTEAGGKQGNIEGSFSLPIALDGLLSNNTYTITLKGEVYDKNLGTYKSDTALGTFVARTDAADPISVQLKGVDDGIGVSFWLNNMDAETVKSSNGVLYYDKTEYTKGVPASYRNLTGLVFELWGATGDDPDNYNTLIGNCTVTFGNITPGRSSMYARYYGSNAYYNANTVGVGDSFRWKFSYTDGSGTVYESGLEKYSGFKIMIKDKEGAYDYTYNRRLGSTSLYDYFLTGTGLETSQYINYLNCVSTAIYCKNGTRPISPTEVLNSNGYALSVTDEKDNSGSVSTIAVDNNFKDGFGYSKTVTFYAVNQEDYDSKEEWNPQKSLDDIKSDHSDILGFRLTLPVNRDENNICTIPKLYIHLVKGEATAPNNVTAPNAALNDTGFIGYVKRSDGDYEVYVRSGNNSEDGTESYFFETGESFIFCYDISMDYLGDTTFSYPSSYYNNGWVTDGVYIKSTTLQSKSYLLTKQEPIVQTFLNSTTTDSSTKTGTDIWTIYLNDPDNAVIASSLQGYLQDADSGVILSGGLYEQDKQLSPLAPDKATEEPAIRFTIAGTEYVMRYSYSEEDDTYGNLVADIKKVEGIRELALGATGEDIKAKQDEIYQALIDAMKEDTGLTVTIDNLTDGANTADPGIWYNWCVQYCYANKISDDQHGTKILAEDNYAGYLDLEQIFNGYVDYDPIDEDGDKISVVFQTGETNYNILSNVYRRMGDVYLTVYKQITEVDETTGKETTRQEEVGSKWCELKFSATNGFTMTFNISEFDNAKLSDAKTLLFEYTFYYDSGERGYIMPESSEESETGDIDDGETPPDAGLEEEPEQYYALYRMTTGARGNYFNSKNNGWDSRTISSNMFRLTNVELTKEYQAYTIDSSANSTAVNVGRREYLDFTSSGYSYSNNQVVSFVPMKTYTKEMPSYDMDQIRPILNQIDSSSGLDEFSLEMQVGNYELMHYPVEDGNDVYFYYLLYEKMSDSEDSDAVKDDDLKLVGAMIGQKGDTLSDEENEDEGEDAISLYRTVTANFTGLKQSTDYVVAIYYKDMRRTEKIDTDDNLFRTVFSGTGLTYQQDELYTNNTVLTRIATLLTGVNVGYWDKTETVEDGEASSEITYRTFETKETSAFGLLGVANETIASNPYEVSTLNGIEIDSMTFQLGYAGRYLLDNGASGKTLEAQITAASDLTKGDLSVRYALERRAIADAGNNDAWETILYDTDLYNEVKGDGLLLTAKNFDEDKEGNNGAATNVFAPPAKDSDGNVIATSFDTLRKVADMYPKSTEDTGSLGDGEQDTKTEEEKRKSSFESLTYYPLQNLTDTTKRYIVPGYTYRMRAVILKTSAGTTDIVSLNKSDNTMRSKTSDMREWVKYEYGDQAKLIAVRNVARETNSFSCSITTRGNGYSYNTWNLLDQSYYVRIEEYNQTAGTWNILTDRKYYGTVYNESIRDHKFKAGYTYDLQFMYLDANKSYRLKFYALADTDYNNQINVVDLATRTVPLGGNDDTTPVFYVENNTGKNNKDTLVSTFIVSTSTASNDWLSRRAEEVLANNSDTIATLAEGQPGTIGTWYKTELNSTTSLTLRLSDASNAGTATRADYSLSFFPSDSSDTADYPTVSGTIYKSAGSVLDGGTTTGLGTLTISNQSFNLTRKGTYYLQVRATYPTTSGGTYVERLDTIVFYVD